MDTSRLIAQYGLPAERLTSLYRGMVLARTFEEAVDREFKAGSIPGWCHLGIGQEAIQVGAVAALRKTDYWFYDHRNKVMLLTAGTSSRRLMAEVFGRETGVCKGKGGEMHIADPTVGCMGNNQIQGANLVVALGTAFASKARGTGQVTAVFFGDGTVGRGEFHESLNLASVWKLPIVYVCANNLYAIATHIRDRHPVADVAEMVAGYMIEADVVDGNDVLAVHRAMTTAVDHARSGQGPYFLEFKTYRWQGHFSGDPASYRPAEEVEYWKGRCPIRQHRTRLIQGGVVAAGELDKLDASVLQEVEDALQYAKDSPFPPAAEAFSEVYATVVPAAASDRRPPIRQPEGEVAGQ